MTREELLTLIALYIENQGNQVDSGGKLPSILRGIMDLSKDGGGVTVVDSMPTASAELAGKLYQYMGVTNPNFEQKAIYICNGSGFKCYKLVNEDTPYYFKVMPIPGGQPKPLFSDEDCTVNVGGVQYLPISGGTYVCNLSDGPSFTTTERETIYSTFAWDRVSAESDPKYYTFATEAEWEVAQEEFEGDEISFILETQETKWGKIPPAPPIKALKFTATGASTIAFNTENELSFEKSTDGKTWDVWDFSEIALADGESVYIRGNNPNGLALDENDATFVMTGSIACEGNVMHLLNYEEDLTEVPEDCFYQLFSECSALTSAPELPATTLAGDCYYDMFYDCTSLVNAPELPATTLADSCYGSMFYGCTSLVDAPELPATTLVDSCYNNMFCGCTSLVDAPELPATTLAAFCYSSMFYGCTSLVDAPELPATTLAASCYNSMFCKCTSLVNAPELPVTTLAESCYYDMFYDCTSLVDAPELPATTLAGSCYKNMFRGCTSLVNAPELPATTLAESCYITMFSGCTSLVDAPELPATTLAASCYNSMFNGCTSLVDAPELPATTLVDSCYNNMFSGCTSLVDAPELPATTLAASCYNSMFNGCTSLVNAPELPATTLVDSCYNNMFSGCSEIDEVTILATDINAYNSLRRWLQNTSASGVIKCDASMVETFESNSNTPSGWTVEAIS